MQTDVHGEEFQTTHFIVFGMSLSVGKWNGDLIIPFTYSKYGLLTGQMFLLVGVVSGRRGDWLSALLSCSLYVSTMMFWYNFRKGRIADIDRCLAIASGVVASVRIPRVAILGVIYFFVQRRFLYARISERRGHGRRLDYMLCVSSHILFFHVLLPLVYIVDFGYI